jgi:hypothetical protein
MTVEKTAEGLIVEGKKTGEQEKAEDMAGQLLTVKKGTNKEIWECCAYLFSKDSFLYRKLNEIMRLVGDDDEEHEALWRAKVPTLGPFALLLTWLGEYGGEKKITVYRGAKLSDDLIQQYQRQEDGDRSFFPAFTSTSLKRSVAENFGNVLFIIDTERQNGYDISPYSGYPKEREYLLCPCLVFRVRSCLFDKKNNRWVIRLHARTDKNLLFRTISTLKKLSLIDEYFACRTIFLFFCPIT